MSATIQTPPATAVATENEKPLTTASQEPQTKSTAVHLKKYVAGTEIKPEIPPDTEPRGVPALDIKCGPLLRYWGMRDTAPDNWRGSILIVTNDPTSDYQRVPTVSLTVSQKVAGGDIDDNSVSSESHANRIHQVSSVSFWRFDLEFKMIEDVEQKVDYYINGDTDHVNSFYIPALNKSMNVMFHSCNGFSLGVDPVGFKGSLWTDVLRKHQDNPFHVMLGGGDQLYCDSVKLYTRVVREWSGTKNFVKKRSIKVSEDDYKEIENYYLWHYISWFGHGYWRGSKGEATVKNLPKAFATIPMINLFDDHDIIDGFGSYHDSTMKAPMFKAIGEVAFKYYLLFQQMVAPNEPTDKEPSWILGPRPGPYIHEQSRSMYARLGKSVAFYGLDCRVERKRNEIVTPATYNAMFRRLNKEIDQSNGEIKHILFLLGVPLAYPRLVWLETILSSSFMAPIKALATKGFFKGLQNEFDGGIEILDDLDDHWCAKHHKAERNNLVKSIHDLMRKKGVRVTILSGDVHLAGIGRFRAKDHSVPAHKDPHHLFNIISSAIVNAPPPDAMADFLNKRNKIHHFSSECNEDMVSIFTYDVDGTTKRNNERILPRRNWCSIIEQGEGHAAQDSTEQTAAGGFKRPGPAYEVPGEAHNEHEVEYLDAGSSLSVVLHMEQDPTNVSGETLPYELIVPALQL